MIYIHLKEALFQSIEEFHVRIAKTIHEACQLIETGFEQIDEFEDVNIYRKRK